MKLSIFGSCIVFSALGQKVTASSISRDLSKREPCTVLAGGFEALDDAPAINAAITRCGDGGTIILPSDQIYSILSPISFAGCNACDVQLEGRLLLTTIADPFYGAPAYISLVNLHGAKFRSLTGKGVIDGQAQQEYQYASHGGGIYDPYGPTPPMLMVANSSDIEINGILAKNILRRFYRVDKGSTNVAMSNLALTIENQWYDERFTRNESIGFHIQESSFVTLTDITVDFRSNNPDVKVGVCVGISWAVSDITLRNIYCNTGDGAIIQFGSGGEYPYFGRYNDTTNTFPAIYPTPEQQFAKNILIQNYTANCSDNAGFQNLYQYYYAKVTNLTYDGVNIVQGRPLVNDLCFVVLHTITAACHLPWDQQLQANFTDVWFKNFRGNAGKPELACSNSNCTCDFHFEGWEASGQTGRASLG
jgi:galacturan 1,4-alpha-galacturonidase